MVVGVHFVVVHELAFPKVSLFLVVWPIGLVLVVGVLRCESLPLRRFVVVGGISGCAGGWCSASWCMSSWCPAYSRSLLLPCGVVVAVVQVVSCEFYVVVHKLAFPKVSLFLVVWQLYL